MQEELEFSAPLADYRCLPSPLSLRTSYVLTRYITINVLIH